MIIYFRIFIILSIANEPGLEPEDFLHGEEIDIDNEIPDGEDPLRGLHLLKVVLKRVKEVLKRGKSSYPTIGQEGPITTYTFHIQ